MNPADPAGGAAGDRHTGEHSRAGEDRRDQLAGALEELRARVAAACAHAGRAAGEVRLLPVTKNFPAADVAILADLGLSEFAENKDQEARAKIAEFAGMRPSAGARWHMVGQVQRNKARTVARWADEVQSVDSPALAHTLARAAGRAREQGARSEALEVLIQVNLDPRGEAGAAEGGRTRGGCPPEGLAELAREVTEAEELHLRGLMMVAPGPAGGGTAGHGTAGHGGAGDGAVGDGAVGDGTAFARLAELHRWLRGHYPEACELSAGMSGDLEAAIAHGSTCVRVGTALLGDRRLASQ